MLRALASRIPPPQMSRRSGTIAAVHANGTYDVTVGELTFAQVESLLGAEYRVGQEVAVSRVGGRPVIES